MKGTNEENSDKSLYGREGYEDAIKERDTYIKYAKDRGAYVVGIEVDHSAGEALEQFIELFDGEVLRRED